MPFSDQNENLEAMPDGEHIERFEDGTIRRQGRILNGKRSGEWLEFHPSGHLASRSTYVKGKKEGLAESFYRDGSPKARRTFKDGLEEGTRMIWYLDGTTWEENFRGGVKHGVWIERKDGEIVSIRRFEAGQEID